MHVVVLLALALSPSAQAGAVVSAFRPENREGANTYNAQAAIDGKLDTVWQVPGESKNIGEYIIIDVPKTTLDKLGMVIGWQASEKKFFDYARVKSVKIEASEYNESMELQPAGTATATFEDKMGWQVVDVPDIVIGQDLFGGKVKITITEVYPGKDYPNVAVAEVLLHMAEFDAAPKLVSVSSEDENHLGLDLMDDDDRTYWLGDSDGASITFDAAGFSLSRLGLKSLSNDYDRPKKVRITANRRTTEVDLPDSLDEQWIEIPAIVGFTGSAWGEIKLEILDVYPGTKHPGKIGLRGLDAKATAFEG
ncbi:MAG: discoidin domain-containing protein [Oligoflexia bacterium]|nr:discoidin domain-containing protein [Oligoflexia bacterium]